MAPDILTSLETGELRDLAAKIRDYQQRHMVSDSAFCKRFPDLGHSKTWKKVREGEFDGLNLERQLANYRVVWVNIEAVGEDMGREEELYEGVWATVKLANAFLDTMTERDVSRCIFLLGPSGSGKSSALRWLQMKYGSRVLTVRGTVVWSDSPMAMLGAILAALGIKDAPMNASERLARVQEKLNETRRCIMVEDAHHLGPRLLNLLITLIDTTPGEVILAAIDRLWSKIETNAYAECRQLTGNRLADRIVIGSEVRKSDAAKLLTHRVKWADESDIEKAAAHVATKANGYGLLGLVREAIKRLNAKQRNSGDLIPATFDDLAAAVSEEIKSR